MTYTKLSKRFKFKRDVWSNEYIFKTVTCDSGKKDFNVNFRKENHFYAGYKVLNNKFNELMDIRFYSTGRACYCCVWISNYKDFHTSGTARATGYGYNRESSAFNSALRACGFDYVPCFGGSGVNKFGIEFVMKFLGVKNFHIVEIFG